MAPPIIHAMALNHGHFSDLLGRGRAALPSNATMEMYLMKKYLRPVNIVLNSYFFHSKAIILQDLIHP